MKHDDSKKKAYKFYFRSLVSIFLLSFFIYKAGLPELWKTISRANLVFLFVSLGMTPVLILLSAWKWHVILKAMHIRVPLPKCFWLYVVGYFFNTILPTNVGGDVVRAYSVGKTSGKKASAFSSVFIERFTGLSILIFMALIAFFFAFNKLWNRWLNIALLLSLFGYISILVVVLNQKLFLWLSNNIHIRIIQVILIKLKRFQDATLSLKNETPTLIFAFVNSVLFYIFAAINVYTSALAFNSSITFVEALIITPIVMVVTMIPISIGGIGLAEGAYFFTFSRMGLLGTVGLSVALLLRAKALGAGLMGGIYYTTTGMNVKDEIKANSQHKIISDDVQGEIKYFSGFEDVMRQKKSRLQKYKDIQLGQNSLWKLLKYEWITISCGTCPGLFGYFLRQLFFPLLFNKLGKGIVFGRNITLQHAHKISLGNKCVIDDYSKLSAQGDDNSSISLGNEVLLGRGTVIGTRNGQIEIGDYCNIGADCRLGTTTKLKVGKHVLLAAGCYIGGAQHKFDRLDIPIMRQGYDSKGGIIIEDDVWLGAGVKVLDGVTIGTGSVIGASSLVTKDIPPFSVAMGIPAKVTDSRKK